MSENFASFYRKASSVRELVGKAPFPEKVRFQITKVIELPTNQYRRYMNELLRDVSFISRNVADMRFDGKTETFLCLFVTCRDANTGLLVESEGFGYARYAAFIPEKSALSLDGKAQIADAQQAEVNLEEQDARRRQMWDSIMECAAGYTEFDNELVRQVIQKITVDDAETIHIHFRDSDVVLEQEVE